MMGADGWMHKRRHDSMKPTLCTTLLTAIWLVGSVARVEAFSSNLGPLHVSYRKHHDGSPFLLRTPSATDSPSVLVVSARRRQSSSSPPSSSSVESDFRAAVYDADKDAAEQAKKAVLARRRERLLRTSGGGAGASAAGGEKDDPEWKFFDTARVHVSGGAGGNGCVAFRREKGEPMGGPAGGRGGRGGSVYLECDSTINTLAPVRNTVHVRAVGGRNGSGKSRDGASGSDTYVRVPPGTVVRELTTQRLAGELREHGETLLVARGGRGGRGNAAFMTSRYTAPKIAERGEPGAKRWLALELRLVADVGFVGKPNAGKSTLLAAASAARPKIANYPFTTIVPNLGVCDLGDDNDGGAHGAGLVLCDIPGLIQGAADGAGLGQAFLRHVQRCKVLLHLVDGTAEDPLEDFRTINQELQSYDPFLATKPQVVVLNKIDVSEVRESADELLQALRNEAGHSRVLAISAVTSERVRELMGRLRKFVAAQPEPELPPPPEISFDRTALELDSDDYEIISDPAYPGQWRLAGDYIEQVASMTHWEYPEAVERFGRQMEALGIARELESLGAAEGDLVMVGDFDFEFSPRLTSPFMPPELLLEEDDHDAQHRGENQHPLDGNNDKEAASFKKKKKKKKEGRRDERLDRPWRPFPQGGFLDVDVDELQGFEEKEDWDFLHRDDEQDAIPFRGMEGTDDTRAFYGEEDYEFDLADFSQEGDDENDVVWMS